MVGVGGEAQGSFRRARRVKGSDFTILYTLEESTKCQTVAEERVGKRE